MSEPDLVEERLQRLARATDSLVASSGFVERVLASVGSTRLVWWELLAGPARWLLPAAAVLALVALGWAYEARGRLDESLAVGFGAESYSTLEQGP